MVYLLIDNLSIQSWWFGSANLVTCYLMNLPKIIMIDSTILVELQEYMGSDESIANSAWTSTYDKEKRQEKYDDKEKVRSIVRRLILDGHGTPIESVVFRFWIRLPIFVDRQHMTHRIASHNGLSGRYRTMPEDYYHIPDDVRFIVDKCDLVDAHKAHEIMDSYESICHDAIVSYKSALQYLKINEEAGLISNKEFKRAREILRGQLPVAGMTERTTLMNLRSFSNYQRQRNSDYAQPEIRRVAQLMLQEVENANICPVAIATLKEIGWRV